MVVKLTITSKDNLSYKDRLRFLGKITGEINSFSLIHKFSHALGFKDVSFYTETPCDGILHEPKIETPEEYTTPEEYLYNKLDFFDEKNEIISLVVKEEMVKHPNSNYSFQSLDMLFKFARFVNKVFPQLDTSFETLPENYNQSIINFATCHFLTCLAYCDYCETEFSCHKILDKKEKKEIMRVINKIDPNLRLEQYWCDTCYSYHKDAPYHTELTKMA